MTSAAYHRAYDATGVMGRHLALKAGESEDAVLLEVFHCIAEEPTDESPVQSHLTPRG
jgi:hypothetical protein